MKTKDGRKITSVITVVICAAMMLTGCSTSKNEVETYKIQLGKKCTLDGNVFSYVWLHSVYGDQKVKGKYCK